MRFRLGGGNSRNTDALCVSQCRHPVEQVHADRNPVARKPMTTPLLIPAPDRHRQTVRFP